MKAISKKAHLSERFKIGEWNSSYLRKENFLFSPDEEIVRFFSNYICKRTGLHTYRQLHSFSRVPRVLDLGCGIGRHIIFAHQCKLRSYGIDLSDTAVAFAKEWATRAGIRGVDERIVQGNIRRLPWSAGFFDCIVSHGVIDSLPFDVATAAVNECSRVLMQGGLFYCDLISGDDSRHSREFAGEETVASPHEHGTIQSYFNYSKIEQLFGSHFQLVDVLLIRRDNITKGGYVSRYHIVARKK